MPGSALVAFSLRGGYILGTGSHHARHGPPAAMKGTVLKEFLFHLKTRFSAAVRHSLILTFKQWFFKGHYTRREVLFMLACRYGTKGIEIGACHHPMRLWRRFNHVLYLDIETKEQWKKTVSLPPAEIMRAVRVDIIDDANTLAAVSDNSQDFLIANHVIEHCRNPIATLGNMFRVLKPEGALYLSIPDKRFTFDAPRQATSMQHFRDDYEKGPEVSDEAHYREWARVYEKLTDHEAIEKRTAELLRDQINIHFHCWSPVEMIEFFLMLIREYGFKFDIEMMCQNGIETVFVFKKQ